MSNEISYKFATDATYSADDEASSTYWSANSDSNYRHEYGDNIDIKRASNHTSTSFSEIEEVKEEENGISDAGNCNGKVMINEKLDLIKENEISWLRSNEDSEDQDTVYIAVDKNETSMDALIWTLNNVVNPLTTVYLIHVFPELKWIPSPFGNGKVPRSQVRKETLDKYLQEETTKRRQLLNKYIDKCNAQKVKVETMLIESDMEAKAILELISVLNIKNLILGVSKSNIRKLRSGKGNGVPDQILQKAPDGCRIKCICEGKDVFEDSPQTQTGVVSPGVANENNSSTRTPSLNLPSSNVGLQNQLAQTQRRDSPSFYCCFKA